MTTTTEVADLLERVDNIINRLDEICDHMDGFSSAEEAWLSSITETLRTWRYVMQETYEARKCQATSRIDPVNGRVISHASTLRHSLPSIPSNVAAYL